MVEHMHLFGYQTVRLKQIPLRFSVILDSDKTFVGYIRIGAWLFSKKYPVKGIIHQEGKDHYVYFVHPLSKKDSTAVVYSLTHGDGTMSGYFGHTPKRDGFDLSEQEFPNATALRKLKSLVQQIGEHNHIGTAHLSIAKVRHK